MEFSSLIASVNLVTPSSQNHQAGKGEHARHHHLRGDLMVVRFID
jgi:hypothetical protein